MAPYVAALARHGVEGFTVGLPRGRAEAAVPAYRKALAAVGAALPDVVIGGQSYGGRVATLLGAEEPVAGLVLLSYPLHLPGKPDWQARTSHWPSISCPVLLLSGESDPFARMPLLHDAVELLSHHELVTYPGVGHGLGAVMDDAMERVAHFVAGLNGRG